MKENRFMIFSLTKRGCIHYAQTAANLLSKHLHRLYISKFADPGYSGESIPIHTYRSLGEALVCTPVFFFTSLRILWRARNQQLIVYLPSFHPWNLILCFWCVLFGIQSILSIHEIQRHAGEENKLIDFIQFLTASLATNLVFLSNFERNKIKKKNWWKKSKVIPHPLIGASFIKENTRVFHPNPKLLFLGRKHEYKGIQLLLNVIADLPDYSYSSITLAGMGAITDDSFTDKSKLRILDKYLSNEELSIEMASHDILILPYTEASQSGILAMGVQALMPMIITKLGGLPEQLSGDAALFVEPDQNSIKNAILSISTDSTLFDRIKTNLQFEKANQLARDSLFASTLISWK